jgi:hypothetical protein
MRDDVQQRRYVEWLSEKDHGVTRMPPPLIDSVILGEKASGQEALVIT